MFGASLIWLISLCNSLAVDKAALLKAKQAVVIVRGSIVELSGAGRFPREFPCYLIVEKERKSVGHDGYTDEAG